MLTVNSEVKKIYGKTEGKVHSKTGVSPIEFNANDQGLISWTMLGNGDQTGTPAPDAPIMPDFCGVRTGNLFDVNGEKTTGITTYNYTISGLTPNTPYTCSTNFVGNKSLEASVYFNGGISVQNDVWSDLPRTSNSDANGEVTIYVRYNARPSSNPAIYDDLLSGEIWIMLNTGSTALPYEPYGWAEKITCGGQTTPVYLGQTQTVRKIRKLVFDGTEDWIDSSIAGSSVKRYRAPLPLMAIDGSIQVAFCTHYQYVYAANDPGFNLSQVGTSAYFRSDFADDVPAWKSYLAQQYANGTPVTIWYVLAEPTTGIVNEPLAKIDTYADELHSADTTVTIPTQNGANTISVDAVVPPSSLTIQYTSPDMSEIVRAVDGQGKPLYGPRYGFKIDKSQTDSASAIIYTHDAVTMTPAYMDYTNGSFNYGSWGNAWFVKEAKPVALNLDGTVAYYLDPNDYTKKLDGTNSDIFYTLLSTEPSDWSTQWKQYYHLNNGEYVLNDDAEAPTFAANTYYKLETSFTGNFMVQFPKVYFKRYEDENYNYVEVSDRKLSRDFKAYAHLNANGDELDFIYLPMFKGVIQSSKLRSIPGVIPQGGTTASAEVTAAEACGTGWQIWDHSSREMINDLLILMSKSIDCQTAFGKGRESGYNSSDTVTYGKLQTGTLIRKGLFFGYSSSYSEVKVFGIEGFWANRWDRLQGVLLDDNVWKIKMTPPYNFTGTDFTTLSRFDVPSGNGYLSRVSTSHLGSIPASISGGASNKFYKDYFYKTATGVRVGRVGGACDGGSGCGFRCVSVSGTASHSYWGIGASPIYK